MKTHHLAWVVAAAMSAAMASPSALAQNLVTNGGFETGNFDGWMVGNPNQYVDVTDDRYIYEGNFGARLGTVGRDSTLTQSLATVEQSTYNISFALANFSSTTPNNFSVSFGGVVLGTPLVNSGEFPYTVFNYTGVATSATTDLVFTVRHDPDFYGLDSVSVTQISNAVPEPATWAMMLVGFAAVGAAVRRRRSAGQFATA